MGIPGLRLVRIVIATALMTALVAVVGEGLREEARPAVLPLTEMAEMPSVPVESGVFRRAALALDYLAMPEPPARGRTLAVFYARRAYPGAPPAVPHEILDPGSHGDRACLACHEHGGYAPRFDAYAPVTPHPELASCLMCHVPVADPRRPALAPAAWQPAPPPPIRRAALPGSPPPIPHGLHFRENCLACHAGPAAVVEIRTTHPERVNCRQCHALASGAAAFAGAAEWLVP